ncbi:MAG: hypothetical protein MRY63_06945 [Neomegalonema sp.]|nr:hypothetical protein [Neomegalonema sp.]
MISFFDRLIGGEDRRAPQPFDCYDLHAAVRPQLYDLKLQQGRPVLAVDVDEVVLDFANHLHRFVAERGYHLDRREERLESGLRESPEGPPLAPGEIARLIDAFFRSETRHQELVPQADESLLALSEQYEIVFVTNVPFFARTDRVANLADHGLRFPLIANEGGKGWVLRYLWDHSEGPMAYIDDYDVQLSSCAQHAPSVRRVQFIADELLRSASGRSEHAHHHAEDWAQIRQTLADNLRAAA